MALAADLEAVAAAPAVAEAGATAVLALGAQAAAAPAVAATRVTVGAAELVPDMGSVDQAAEVRGARALVADQAAAPEQATAAAPAATS